MGSNPIGSDGAMCLLLALEKNDSSAMTYLEMFNVRVTVEFVDLENKLKEGRDFVVLHAGIKYETSVADLRRAEPDEWWVRDPMTKLRRYIKDSGYRLIDLFKDFDKDGNQLISRSEFYTGIKQAGIILTEEQIEELIKRLDKDKNGCIDFGELLEGDREYKRLRRQWNEEKAALRKAGHLSASSARASPQIPSVREMLDRELLVQGGTSGHGGTHGMG